MKKLKATEEVTGTDTVVVRAYPKIDKLDVKFDREDMNKVVEKINEIIEQKCQ